MKIPRDLSGQDLVKLLCKKWGYKVVHQSGSHIILETEVPKHQRMAIPNHSFLRIGTLNSILKAIAEHKGIAKESVLTD